MTEHAVIIAILMLTAAAGLIGIFCSLFYDVLQLNSKKNAIHPYSRALRKRPDFSTILFVERDDDIRKIERSLLSIAGNSYRKIEIIVIASEYTESVSSVVSKVNKKYPSKKVRLEIQHTDGIKDASEHAVGNIVMIMRNPYVLEKDTIAAAVKYFAANNNSNVIVPRINIDFRFTVRSLLEQYENILRDHWMKVENVIPGFSIRQTNALIGRKEYIGTEFTATYNNEIVLFSTSGDSVNESKTFKSASLLYAAFVSYLVYIAFVQNSGIALAACWVGFSSYFVFNVLADSGTDIRKKVNMIFLAPLASFVFYLTALHWMLNIFLTSTQSVRHQPRVEPIS